MRTAMKTGVAVSYL